MEMQVKNNVFSFSCHTEVSVTSFWFWILNKTIKTKQLLVGYNKTETATESKRGLLEWNIKFDNRISLFKI